MSDAILARDALAAIEKLKERLRKFSEPIAIVGWSMRGPGADSPAAFWDLLKDGVDATSEVPESRWSAADWYSPDGAAPGKARTKRGGFVSDVEHFDPAFFRISPLEASVMDPRQRFALELSHEALTRAGLPTSGGKVGVFLGASGQVRPLEIATDRATYAATGSLSSVIAGRVSYTFGFTGPALVVDTACSSSLLAVHLACESLRQGACDAALAGGVSLQLDPDFTVALSKFGALARDGRCKTFDASGDGYGRGEGCGIAVLKRLSDAERDGDFIWAVIRGTASNQDGPSSGLSAPNVTAQVELARAALKQAKLTPADVQYIEAHGTGTVLGDPIEVEALTEVYGPGHSPASPLAIGSVKSNIGHLEWAAGISGLLKAVLAIHHRQIPPSLHFKTPNPHIPWDQIPFRVQTSLGRWPDDTKPLVAAVSSFGFSGTNVHVVLGETPRAGATATATAVSDAPLPIAISATSEPALRAYAGRYAAFLDAGVSPPWTLRDVAFTSCVRQAHLEHRLVVAAATPAEAAARLRAFAESGTVEKGLAVGRASAAPRPLVFVFSGQGSQWLGMAVELLDKEPVFRAEMERCDAALRPWIETSVIAELRASEGQARLDDGSVVQPVLFAIQTSLVALWSARGVVPDVVLGHSMGEVAAAFVAGALSLEDAARVIAVRSRLMHRVRGRGAMALVGLSVEEAEREIAPHAATIAIAGINGPRSTVVSGDGQAIADLVRRMEARDVFCRAIKIDVASHSPQLDGLRDDLLTELAPLRPQQPSKRFVSTALATSDETPAFDAAYWWTNLRQPVRFGPRIDQLIAEGHELFVEVSPHPILGSAVDELLAARARTSRSIPSLERKRPEREALLEALGALHARGHAIPFAKLFPDGGRVVPLPTYPWERQRFPLVSPASPAASTRWPLVGKTLEVSDRPSTHLFELALSLKDPALAYFAEHRVKDAVWFPGAGFVELALEAASEVFGDAPITLTDLTFGQALMLSEDEPVRLQLALKADPAGSRFTIASRAAAEGASWVTHVTGSIERGVAVAERVGANLAAIEARHPDERDAAELYAAFAAQGLGYGPRFQGIARAFRGSGGRGEALVRLAPATALASDHARYRLHPSILDAAFQASLVALSPGSAIETFVPASIGAVRVHRSPTAAAFAHASVVERAGGAAVVVVRLLDETGDVLVTVDALRLAPLGEPTDRLDGFLYDVTWRPLASSAAEDPAGPWLIVGSGGGVGEGLAEHLRARGAEVISLPSSAKVTELLHDASATPPRRVVYLESLALARDLADPALEAAREIACMAPLELLRGIAQKGWGTPPRVIAVTRGAQAVLGSADVLSPLPALLWGLFASAAHELAELAPTVIDLETASTVQTLAGVLLHLDDENRIAIRGEERYVARLARHTPARSAAPAERSRQRVGDLGYRLDPTHLGNFDALALRPAPRRPPGPGEIEVAVRASGINFRDVLAVLGDGFAKGRYEASGDRLPIGGECAGVVVRTGEGVTAFAPGDPVVCTPVHAFDSHVIVPEHAAVKKPPGLSFEEASALPSVTMTVLWALERVGHLRKGERILIHAATGGVGLAAVQYAKHVGAEIFATAGSPDKRAYLASLGISHVYDSRSLAWADEVLRDTQGRGVDVVLNSLAGEAIAKGLAVLAPFGRFLEIGKRDIYTNTQVGLYALRNNVSVSAIALDQLQVERPDDASALLRDVFRGLETGAFAPQPTTTFPISRAADAFAHLAMAKHIGKVVLTAEDEVDVLVEAHARGLGLAVSADKTYLITGGLGGLGLVVASRLVALGARHLALLGRTAQPSTPELAQLRAGGATVHLLEGDVGDRGSLERALAMLPASAPPIGGIVHAAGLVADATLPNLTRERFDTVLAPKMYGARNLAELIPGPLDFFVLFSSVAAVLGSPGQANYAAANAFLDAFAHTQRGRRALAIDWGAWSDVGMAVRGDRADNVVRQGLGALAPSDGADLFARLLAERGAIVAMEMDFRQWRQLNPQAAGLPFLRDFRAEAKTTARESPTLARLREAPPEEAGPILETYLRNAVRGITRGSLERTGVDVPLKDLGVDSLMMVSFKNVIERDLALTVSTASLYSYPTIRKLAAWALTKLAPTEAPPDHAPPTNQPGPPTGPTAEAALAASADAPVSGEVEMSLEEALRLASGGS